MEAKGRYCQLELGGKLRGLKFNLHALQTLEKIFPKEKDIDTMAFLTQLIYVGLCGNRFVKTMGTEPVCEETFEEISDWVDEKVLNGQKDFIKVVNDAFESSKDGVSLGKTKKTRVVAKKK